MHLILHCLNSLIIVYIIVIVIFSSLLHLEWMNVAFIQRFIVHCCTPKALYNHVGLGGGLSLTTTSEQHPLGWCNGCHSTMAPVCSPHTSYRWRGERVIEPIKCMRSPHTSYRWRGERVIEPIKWMGIIRRPWLTRARGGHLARTPGFRHVQRGGRRVLEHLPLCTWCPKCPFIKAFFFFFY